MRVSITVATTIATIVFFAVASLALAQSDRGTITGTVTDPAGAVVANASIQTRNIETGAQYQAATTATGNYTISQMPAGTYELSLEVPGFKKYVRQGLTVLVAQTLRIDVGLEIGSSSESITVQADAPLLKTESGELSHNVTTNRLDELPIMGIGSSQAGGAGIRNPYAVTQLIPGTYFVPNATVRVNGAPANTQSFRIEGQEAANGFTPGTTQQLQPSVDSIQEFAIQTSNFAAEYGQVGGGYFNVTMKSGTNQFHGSAYDYFVNEVLNAGMPFTNNGSGGLIRPAQRRNDYGFTLGGPVWIPKIYNGHDKTFFFFNFEQFRETQQISQPTTVPTLDYRNGNFAGALTGKNLCPAAIPNCDPLGRSNHGRHHLRSEYRAARAQRSVDSRSVPQQCHSNQPIGSGCGGHSKVDSGAQRPRRHQQLPERVSQFSRHRDSGFQDRSVAGT